MLHPQNILDLLIFWDHRECPYLWCVQHMRVVACKWLDFESWQKQTNWWVTIYISRHVLLWGKSTYHNCSTVFPVFLTRFIFQIFIKECGLPTGVNVVLVWLLYSFGLYPRRLIVRYIRNGCKHSSLFFVFCFVLIPWNLYMSPSSAETYPLEPIFIYLKVLITFIEQLIMITHLCMQWWSDPFWCGAHVLGWEIWLEFRRILQLFQFRTFSPPELSSEFHFSDHKICSPKFRIRSRRFRILSRYQFFQFHVSENVRAIFYFACQKFIYLFSK